MVYFMVNLKCLFRLIKHDIFKTIQDITQHTDYTFEHIVSYSGLMHFSHKV